MTQYATGVHTRENALNPNCFQPSYPSRGAALGRPLRVVPPPSPINMEQITELTQRSADSLSKTSAHVLALLLEGDLSRLRSDAVADELGISPTTLRRRLRADRLCYQELLDLARQHRCEQQLGERWVPGKTLAFELGYAEVNSFYRAFKRWTGARYSEIKLQYI